MNCVRTYGYVVQYIHLIATFPGVVLISAHDHLSDGTISTTSGEVPTDLHMEDYNFLSMVRRLRSCCTYHTGVMQTNTDNHGLACELGLHIAIHTSTA